MKSLSKPALCILFALTTASCTLATAQSCSGKLLDPVTDICWSCIFPISIGPAPVKANGQEDIENVSAPLCFCGIPPFGKTGVPVGFWEPARQVDVTRTPWCFPSLGGIQLALASLPVPTPAVGQGTHGRRASRTTFYQAHWYVNPVLYWLKVLSNTSCLEEAGFDLAYVTELDPAWNDDELAIMLSPEAFLFANPAAQAACAADCIAASAGFPLAAMPWCGGCQGAMFPLNGHVQTHVGGVQASSLIMQRYAMKLHRELLAFAGNGPAGWCGLYPAPMLDKRIYKYSMLYPSPQGVGPDGRCCQPMGRTTAIWGAGKEFPIKGEDFAYMMYRKRNCCERLVGWRK